MDQHKTYFNQSINIPTNNVAHKFLESMNIQKTFYDTRRIILQTLVDTTNQRICMLYDTGLTLTDYISTIKWVKAWVWFINRDAMSAIIKYKYLNWGWTSTTNNIVTTVISLNEKRTTFTLNFMNGGNRMIFAPK